MSRSKWLVAVVLVGMLAVAACGPRKAKKLTGGDGGKSVAATLGTQAASFLGSWASACDNGIQYRWTFNANGTFTHENLQFLDLSCKGPSDVLLSMSGDFVVSAAVPGLSNAFGMDLYVFDSNVSAYSEVILYDIFQLGNGTIYMSSAFSADQRPTSLNLQMPFAKL